MWLPISVKREHPTDPMIPGVSISTGTNSKFNIMMGSPNVVLIERLH